MTNLSLNKAFELADNLDRAYRHAASLESNHAAATAVPPENHTEVQMDLAAATSKYVKRGSCYFSGGSIHLKRKLCPAKDTICHGCGKRGHLVKVCRKTKEEKFNAASSSMSTESNPQCNTNEKSSWLASVIAGAPACLSPPIVTATPKEKHIDVLVDSGASSNFID